MVVTPENMYTTSNPVIAFLVNNIWIVAGVVVIIIVVYSFVKIKDKKPKIISRSDIEKKRRIDDIKLNNCVIPEFKENLLNYETGKIEKADVVYNKYNWLQHGNKLLGSILAINKRTSNPNNEETYEILFKPPLIGKISNPFKQDNIIIVMKEDVILFKKEKSIMIKHEVSIDKNLGIFYTTSNEEKALNLIDEHRWKTTAQSNADIEFVEAQKRSTLDLDYAHAMSMKEKEIQLELAKKRGKMSSI